MNFIEFLDHVSPKENVSTLENHFEPSKSTIAEEENQSSEDVLAHIERNINNPKADITWRDLIF